MKRFLIITLTLLLAVALAAPVLASPPRVVDDADLLTTEEEQTLIATLDAVSVKHGVDVAIVTVSSLGGKSARDYADDYYDINGYGLGAGDDGILLLIGMETRDYYITTHGYGITALTDAGIEYVSSCFRPYLSSGDWAQAFDVYATECDALIARAKAGDPYDVHDVKAPFPVAQSIGISLVVGLVAALIVTGILKGQLKSVRRQTAANSYVRQNSLHITASHDRFLYRNVSRRAKPKDTGGGGGSSVHTSSSGRSHGGGGGKF